jgi:peptide/nickel transport system substrate-binding protein
MDPHYPQPLANNSLLNHIFERLVEQDERQRLTPELAESWKTLDPNPGRSSCAQREVPRRLAVYRRRRAVQLRARAERRDSPSSFGIYIQGKTLTKVDDHTIHIKTASPYPLMPNDLSTITSSRRRTRSGAKTPDYNSGKARSAPAVPLRRVHAGQPHRDAALRPVLGAEAAMWQRVTFRPIKSDPSRVAALLAGDVDIIEEVPATDMRAPQEGSEDHGGGGRVEPHHLPAPRPVPRRLAVRARQGRRPIKNPLRDVRVRRALSMSIDRDAIVSRGDGGHGDQGRPAAARGLLRREPEAEARGLRPNGAKKLLAEAGVPNGFRLTIHSPNDRYPNDAKIAEAVGQMLSATASTPGGDDDAGRVLPRALHRLARQGPQVQLHPGRLGSGTGEASSPLKSLLATFDATRAWARRTAAATPRRSTSCSTTRSPPSTIPSAPRCSRARPRWRSRTSASSRCTTRSTPGRCARVQLQAAHRRIHLGDRGHKAN